MRRRVRPAYWTVGWASRRPSGSRRNGRIGPRKGVHRKKRPRRPLIGMLLHQDGSRHRWIPGQDCDHDLIVTMDDATSYIYAARLVEEEGTMSSFLGLREVIAKHGLFCA